jgi:hypothetical protein
MSTRPSAMKKRRRDEDESKMDMSAFIMIAPSTEGEDDKDLEDKKEQMEFLKETLEGLSMHAPSAFAKAQSVMNRFLAQSIMKSGKDDPLSSTAVPSFMHGMRVISHVASLLNMAKDYGMDVTCTHVLALDTSKRVTLLRVGPYTGADMLPEMFTAGADGKDVWGAALSEMRGAVFAQMLEVCEGVYK